LKSRPTAGKTVAPVYRATPPDARLSLRRKQVRELFGELIEGKQSMRSSPDPDTSFHRFAHAQLTLEQAVSQATASIPPCRCRWKGVRRRGRHQPAAPAICRERTFSARSDRHAHTCSVDAAQPMPVI